ncbi:MAG: NAD(+) synthase [Desulfovibrio sp.]|nr:NAD(+) synthase [Desulfovibrio sp.]
MQMALLQCATRCGDFAGNLDHLEECLRGQPDDVLYLLPPNALCGVELGSLAQASALPGAQSQALQQLAARFPQKHLLVPFQKRWGKEQRFCCAQLKRGQFHEIPLTTLSSPAGLAVGGLAVEGKHLGLVLGCQAVPREDPLADFTCQAFAGKNLDALCFFAAFAWSPGLQACLESRYAAFAKTLGVPLFAVAAVGGEDGSVFHGQSLAMTSQGRLSARARAFQEELLRLDAKGAQAKPAASPAPLEALWLAMVRGTADFVQHSGLSKVFVGLSGGLDSALVLTVAAHALGPEQVYAVLMPSPYTSQASKEDAAALVRNLGVQSLTLPITPLMQTLQQYLEPTLQAFPAQRGDVTWENLQARLRGLLLSTLANRAQALVLNTSNKSEAAMGYSTLYGDTIGALAVIGDLTKTQVYAVAHWYRSHFPKEQEIPLRILEKAPSAELAPNQKDSDSLPEYSVLDPVLEALLAGSAPTSEGECSLQKRLFAAEFKRRQEPLALMLSTRAFGSVYRLPVTARFRPPVLA